MRKYLVENGYQITNARKCFEIDVEYAMGGYTSTVRQNSAVKIRTKFDSCYSGLLRDYVSATKEGEQDSLIIERENGEVCKVGIHDISFMEVL